jgi:carbamoyl-phosphate synthase large subunit
VDDVVELRAFVPTPATFLVQELLEGDEYGVDVLNDLEGTVLAVTVKRKLAMRSGETDKSVTAKVPEILELGRRTARALGHVGNLDMDVFLTPKGPAILELNPRFGGGYPGSHVAGARYPRKFLDSLLARPPKGSLDDYEEGVYCFKGIGLTVARQTDLDAFPRLGRASS